MLTPWKKSYDQPKQHIKKQRYYFANKGSSSQGYGFSSNHVWMWELDYKERWAPKNWCFWTVVLEETLESPLDCKEIQPVHPKGNQSWISIGRTDAEAETPIIWSPDVKNWLTGKDPDAGKDWRQEDKRMTEDEMVGWHRWLDGHEFEQVLGVGGGGAAARSLQSCQLFATLWTAAHQASLSITNSQSLLKLISIELVMPSNHLILCHPLVLLSSIFPSIRIFSSESVLRIRWPKLWSFSFSISPSNEYSGLISFRMDWLDLLAFQGTLKSPHYI